MALKLSKKGIVVLVISIFVIIVPGIIVTVWLLTKQDSVAPTDTSAGGPCSISATGTPGHSCSKGETYECSTCSAEGSQTCKDHTCKGIYNSDGTKCNGYWEENPDKTRSCTPPSGDDPDDDPDDAGNCTINTAAGCNCCCDSLNGNGGCGAGCNFTGVSPSPGRIGMCGDGCHASTPTVSSSSCSSQCTVSNSCGSGNKCPAGTHRVGEPGFNVTCSSGSKVSYKGQCSTCGNPVGCEVCCVPDNAPSCYSSCDTDQARSGSLICSRITTDNTLKWRNPSCPGESDCTCDTPSEDYTCWDTGCNNGSTCDDGTRCVNGRCINPTCPTESDCTCDVPDSCTVTATAECDEYNRDARADVTWMVTASNFPIDANNAKVIVRIEDNSDSGTWFTEGADTWWATNFAEFVSSGRDPKNAGWTFSENIRFQRNYQVRVSVAPKIHNGSICDAPPVNITCPTLTIVEEPYCGDGTVDPGEACDDGNRNNNDSCRNDCTYCGDGVVQPGEQCDDGNNIDTDECSNDCEIPEDWDIDKLGDPTCYEEINNTYAEVDYVITVTNYSDATQVLDRVEDVMDERVDASWIKEGSISPTYGIATGNTIVWDLDGTTGSFAPGESKVFSYTLVVPLSDFGEYLNTATGYPIEGESFQVDNVETVICTEPEEPVIPDEPLPETGLLDNTIGRIGAGLLLISVSGFYFMSDGLDKHMAKYVTRTGRVERNRKRFEDRVRK